MSSIKIANVNALSRPMMKKLAKSRGNLNYKSQGIIYPQKKKMLKVFLSEVFYFQSYTKISVVRISI